jgi:hypothetical protein
MSTEVDFKALWNKEEAKDMPNTKDLLEKAGALKRKVRNKLIGFNLLLLATAAYIICVGFNIDNELLITKIGTGLIAIAIISYLVVYDQIIPVLFKSDLGSSSHEYLEQLIHIKRKQEFLNKVMINIYFSLLSVGLFLYFQQFTPRMTIGGVILTYGLSFGWIGFAWFYLRPRGIKKKQKPLNDMIEKLEAMNKQLGGE